MVVVGINAFHGDASAVIAVNGQIVAAVEEERFTRIKHWAGMPIESVRCCLEIAGLGAFEVNHWAVNNDNKAHRLRKLGYLLTGAARPNLILSRVRNRAKRSSVEQELARAFGGKTQQFKVHHIEHHLSHLASTFYPSGFSNALAVSIDGFGDFSSAAWGLGGDNGVEPGGYVHFPHSLGIFYQAVTQYLGFRDYGDEYKVMGLAPYGNPSYLDSMEQLVSVNSSSVYQLNLKYFRHHNQPLSFSWERGRPVFDSLYSPLFEHLLGPSRLPDEPLEQRHRNIAASAQQLYENCLFSMLNGLYQKYKVKNLALAGGCAMNSVANGKISERTGFDRVFIQPAAGDAGGALGAALQLNRQLGGNIVRDPMPHAYLGPGFSSNSIMSLLNDNQTRIENAGCRARLLELDDLIAKIVDALVGGSVVGWFQGRMEWGARALGNRSILGDPRCIDMQQILNHKIKRRESFRPFAPSILREHVSQWFEVDDDVPYMQKVYKIQYHRRAQIPAVTHVDGSGRLQTVTLKQNPLYYKLIESFYQKTGVPLLLNTSFNENEPIVCTPQEALECFLRTRMDVLALGQVMLYRESE
ncbi:MAG: carbamoyltransferase C-terminal domain-containing protein [Arenicellales bacterium]